MEFKDIVQYLVYLLIGGAVAVVTCYVIPLLKAKMGNEKWMDMMQIIRMAVTAAESMFRDKQKYGQAKMKYVKSFVTAENADLRKMPDDKLTALIEAEVLYVNPPKKK